MRLSPRTTNYVFGKPPPNQRYLIWALVVGMTGVTIFMAWAYFFADPNARIFGFKDNERPTVWWIVVPLAVAVGAAIIAWMGEIRFEMDDDGISRLRWKRLLGRLEWKDVRTIRIFPMHLELCGELNGQVLKIGFSDVGYQWLLDQIYARCRDLAPFAADDPALSPDARLVYRFWPQVVALWYVAASLIVAIGFAFVDSTVFRGTALALAVIATVLFLNSGYHTLTLERERLLLRAAFRSRAIPYAEVAKIALASSVDKTDSGEICSLGAILTLESGERLQLAFSFSRGLTEIVDAVEHRVNATKLAKFLRLADD